MGFWITTLLTDLLIPITILINGILYLKKPEKHINWMHGYRTERSMKSQETWEFAQRYFGRMCYYCGIGFTLVTFLLMFSVFGKPQKVVNTLGNILGVTECILMVCILFPTERALKKKYDV